MRRLWGTGCMLALACAALLNTQALGLLIQMVAAVVFCLSFWLLMGQGGMVSFGHAVYSGAGAFAAIHLMRAIEQGLVVPMLAVPLAAAGAAALLAWPLGWLATRHHSVMAFAMITLGLGELVWAGAQMFPVIFGGEAGVSANRGAGLDWEPNWARLPMLYLLALAYLAVALLILRAYLATPTGRLLQAVRENPQRVSFVGQDPRRIRHLSFVVAAFLAGLSGSLGAMFNEIVSPEVFSSQRSAAVLIFSLMGGLALMSGAVVGGVLMVLGTVVLSSWTPAWLLYLGLLFIMVLWWLPGGLMPGLHGALQACWRAPVNAAAWVLFALGLGALVEMTYQWRLAPMMGAQLNYLGLVLDTGQPWHWLAGAALMSTALLILRSQRQGPQEGRA